MANMCGVAEDLPGDTYLVARLTRALSGMQRVYMSQPMDAGCDHPGALVADARPFAKMSD